MYLSVFRSFCYQAQSAQISSHLSHQVNSGLGWSMTKPVEIGGSSGAIYLPLLVLHGTA